MTRPISPYHKPGFYDEALAKGLHRDIVGGRWEETGIIQMDLLREAGLEPHHHLLDIGAGSLRLGCRAVPYLNPGHYWATDKSRALMLRGYDTELSDPSRLNPDQLIEDDAFTFSGVPDHITHALAFAVFTHLPLPYLTGALRNLRHSFPALECLLFTVFLAPDHLMHTAHRQPDGVVTHADRAPYHHSADAVRDTVQAAGFNATQRAHRLPRGQVLFHAIPTPR